LVEESGEGWRGRTGGEGEKAGILIQIPLRREKAGGQMGQMRGKHFYRV